MNELAFREPKMIEMAKIGDRRRFLCVMEIQRGQIAGAGFEIMPSEENNSIAWATKVATAWARVLGMAGQGKWRPEGGSWEDFVE